MSRLFVLVVAGLPLLALWLYATVEVLRRRDLARSRRIGWLLVLLLVPVVGLGLYVVARPPRAQSARRVAGLAGAGPGAGRPGAGRAGAGLAAADAIVLAAERRQRGELTDDEYGAAIAAVASFD